MENASSSTSALTRFFIQIDETIEAGNLVKALRLILSNFSHFPDSAPLRERVAQALARKGRKKEAAAILELVARHYANAGYPTRSLAAIKQMHALQPDASPTLLDHFSALYSIRSPYLDDTLAPRQLPAPSAPLDMSAKEPHVGEQELLDLALERSSQKRGLSAQPATGSLPPLPLLSLLPVEVLRQVLDLVEYELILGSQPLFGAEEHAEELIWSVTPNLLLRQEDTYWRIPSGALLGLNGYGTHTAPNEFTISSSRSSEILRLSAEKIARLDEVLGDFSNRLATLRRHALSERLMASHALFAPLDNAQRLALIDRFVGIHVDGGETIIAQGSKSPGLFILLDGQVEVVRNDDSWEITIATLEPGDVFGEIGLISEKPAVAGVVTSERAIMLYLSREDFDDASKRHPAIAKYAAQLASARLTDGEHTLSADDLMELE